GDISAKEERLASLASELDAIPAGYDPERHEAVRRELDRLMPLDARATRYSAQIEREPALQRESASVRQQSEVLAERLSKIRTELATKAVSEEAYAALRAEYEAATQESHAATVALAAAESEETSAAAALEVARR